MADGIADIVTVKIPKELHFRTAVNPGMSVKDPPDQTSARAVTSTDNDWPGMTKQTKYSLSPNLLDNAVGEDWMCPVDRPDGTCAALPETEA